MSEQHVIVIISSPQECGDITINFISCFDGKIIKEIKTGEASYGSINNEIFEYNRKENKIIYHRGLDYLSKQLKKDYLINLPTEVDKRCALTDNEIAKIIADKMHWKILAIYNF